MMAWVRFGQWFGSGQAGWSVLALVPVDSVKPSRLGQTQVNSGATQSTQDPMHASYITFVERHYGITLG
ncbi:hypothetical protein Hanom_Chr15g01378731 [Helianthus anomalus]